MKLIIAIAVIAAVILFLVLLSMSYSDLDEKAGLDEKAKLFTIEFYPITNRYYPKFGNNYLKRDFLTGIIEEQIPRYFIYADSFGSEEEARQCIELFREQQLKENVKTIKYEPKP